MKDLKFHLANFAKVAKADVSLEGITVVVGANNSGKTTIGKALYSLCSVFKNIDERVRQSKLTSIDDANEHSGLYLPLFALEDRRAELLDRDFTVDSFLAYCDKRLPQFIRMRDKEFEDYQKKRVKNFLAEVRKIKAISQAQYRNAVVWDYFDTVFHSQVMPLFRKTGYPEVRVTNGETVAVDFCETAAMIRVMGQLKYKVCYLNGPRCLNLVNSNCPLDALDTYDRELIEDLRQAQSSSGLAGIVNARKVSNRAKLKKLQDKFDAVIPGVVGKKGRGKFSVTMRGHREPILFENLSSGLKSFVLLRHIIEQGVISDGDVLILDEPEVHLHPEWQIHYAELIVLLCKLFDLRILLTSHSVDFIHALHLYVRLHKLGNRLNLYRSVPAGDAGSVTIEPVAGNAWERLFDTFMNPIKTLAELRNRVEAMEDGVSK